MHSHLCKLENFSNLSSHDALVRAIMLPVVEKTNEEIDFPSTYTPFLVSKPKWNDDGLHGYQEQSAEVLKSLLDQFQEPDHIPILCELFSKMLVISAEKNFETISPRNNISKKKKPYFSPQHKAQNISHEKVCKEWRRQGRPQDANHPARIAKLNSQ